VKPATIAVTPIEILANRADLLGRFADALAHEIRNPIHSAVINLELLRRRIASGEVDPALERVGVLERQVARIHELVDALLRVLRPSREGTDLLEIDQVVQEIRPLLDALCAAARVELIVSPVPAGGIVRARRSALHHAVLNLVDNALEAAGRGGTLHVASARHDGEVRIRILDSGHGFDPAVIGRLGVPGVSARPGRAGLGIAVARALVEEVGGSFTLENAGGQGATTTVGLALPAVGHA